MEITGLITAIVFGAIIGGLGRAIVPGRHQMSLLVTILVGIVAAVAGTGVAELIGVADTSGIDWTVPAPVIQKPFRPCRLSPRDSSTV